MIGMEDGVFLVPGGAWSRGLYAILLALALSELITGLIAQQKDEWLLPWVVWVDLLFPLGKYFTSDLLSTDYTRCGL